MVLSTDMCVARMILGLNPLQGPILLDYLTNGIERAHLVEALFERVPSIPRESLNMTKAAQNYWRLVKKMVEPHARCNLRVGSRSYEAHHRS